MVMNSLREEWTLLKRLTKTHRAAHGRTRYHKAADYAVRAIAKTLQDAVALPQLERALHAVAKAYNEYRHLLAQTFFMAYAMVHLAILARAADLLANEHARLTSIQPLGEATSGRPPPILLALAPSSAHETMARLLGSTLHGGTSLEFSAKDGAVANVAGAAAVAEDSDDVGEVVPEDYEVEYETVRFAIDPVPDAPLFPMQDDEGGDVSGAPVAFADAHSRDAVLRGRGMAIEIASAPVPSAPRSHDSPCAHEVERVRRHQKHGARGFRRTLRLVAMARLL